MLTRRAMSVAQSVATNIAIGLLGAVSGIVLARTLGPGERGELAVIQTWPLALVTIGMLGVPEATVVLAARSAGQRLVIIRPATIDAAGAGLAVAAAGFVLLPPLLHEHAHSTVRLAQYTLCLAPLAALGGIRTQAARVTRSFLSWNLLRLVPTLAWGLICVAAALLSVRSARLLALAYIASAVAFVPISFAVTRPGLRRSVGDDWWDGGTARALLRLGLPAAAASVPQVLNLRLDQLILAIFVKDRSLGLYVVAVGWSSAVTMALIAFGAVAMPEIAARVDPGERGDASARTSRVTVLVATAMCSIAVPVSLWLFTAVYGQRYSGARWPAAVLVLAAGALGLSTVLADVLRANDASSAILRAELTGVVLTGALIVPVVRVAGIAGAAVLSLGAYSLTAYSEVRSLARLHGRSPLAYLTPTVSDIGWVRQQLSRRRHGSLC